VWDAAYKSVADALKDAITDYGLEQIVRRLASASGARAVVLPKHGSLPAMPTFLLWTKAERFFLAIAISQSSQWQGAFSPAGG